LLARARITGGVTGRPHFLEEFFPNVAAAQHSAAGEQKSAYCTFDDPGLQAWTSSMFIAGAVTGKCHPLHPLTPSFAQRLLNA